MNIKRTEEEWEAVWAQRKKERIQEYRREYRKGNTRMAQQAEAWRKEHPERSREYRRRSFQRYDAKRRGLECTLTEVEWQEILEDHFHKCHYCQRSGIRLVQEHVIPVSKGGGYTKDNIVPACRSCNAKKNNKDYDDFIELAQGQLF